MAAKVVTPIAVQHIGSSCRELRQVAKNLPLNLRIPGETYLVAMASKAAPTVINHRSGRILRCFPASHTHFVVKENMVSPEGIAKLRHIAAKLVLLPVQPPEIHAHLLHRVENGVEICVRPCFLVDAEGGVGLHDVVVVSP